MNSILILTNSYCFTLVYSMLEFWLFEFIFIFFAIRSFRWLPLFLRYLLVYDVFWHFYSINRHQLFHFFFCPHKSVVLAIWSCIMMCCTCICSVHIHLLSIVSVVSHSLFPKTRSKLNIFERCYPLKSSSIFIFCSRVMFFFVVGAFAPV